MSPALLTAACRAAAGGLFVVALFLFARAIAASGTYPGREKVVRYEAHLDRTLRLSEPDLHPAAEGPRPCQVRVERESPIDERDAVIEVTDDIGESKPGRTQRKRVIAAQISGPSR